MSSPMQAVPSYSQWKAWCDRLHVIKYQYCLYCRAAIVAAYDSIVTIGCRDAIKEFRDNKVCVGCRVKVWDEQVTETAEGEVVKLTSKIVPMSMTGPGCPSCQYLMTKLENEELTRYNKECREWQELHKPRIEYADITVTHCGKRYRLFKRENGARWYNEHNVLVPSSIEQSLFRVRQETCEEHIIAGLEPWMRALGLTAPPYTPQPDSQTRTPSKRQVYIDVTENVLQMPRAKRREDDTYTIAGVK